MAIFTASRYPVRADENVCVKCGRDIARRLHSGQAHVDRPIGPMRYRCRCGEPYLSGAVEWDQMSSWEQKRRARTIRLGILLMLPALLPAALAYGAWHFRSGWFLAAFVLVLIPVLPLLWMSLLFQAELINIAASLWRTKVSQRLFSQENSRT
jgi:hypothetical protein